MRKTEIPTDSKEGRIPEMEDTTYNLACLVLKESGLLEGLSDTDVGRLTISLKYELVSFRNNDLLIGNKEVMEDFLILHEGILKIPLENGKMMIWPGTFWKDQVIGLDVCATDRKTSYFDVYAASDGIAVKYNYQKLLDTTRISTVSRIRLLSNMMRYIAEMNIVRFKNIDLLKTKDVTNRILLYLLQKEGGRDGSPVNLRQCYGVLEHLGIGNNAFFARLHQMKEEGILTMKEELVWLHHPQVEEYLK